MNVWSRLMSAFNAGWTAWQETSGGALTPTLADLYGLRWSLFDGTTFSQAMKQARLNPRHPVYANTRLVYKHVQAVVLFYAANVYRGDLSTDGKPLPDGSLGAIPIDPQVEEAAQQPLRAAIAEFWAAWNWKQQMTLRPMYGAALGDVLTELVDDTERGIVYPAHIWPGYVTDIALDYVGNVKAYRLEYQVTEDHGGGRTETYRYAKEVDKAAFRYFKDDKPFDYYGPGSRVTANPYGFVPAIWDRQQIGWGERGTAATDGTRAALFELNSLFSHGIDFQRKAFAAPIIVKGKITKPGQTEVKLRPRPQTTDDATQLAESLNYLQGDEGADLVQASFDIGQTLAAIEQIKQGILDENPEASFYQQLRQMSQVTAPGAERALGDAVTRCKLARAGYDAQTVKLFQMAIAMAGFRYHEGAGGWRHKTKRQRTWAPYDLSSYAAGALDFSISDREVIPATPAERLAQIAQQENLQTQYALEKSGLSPDDAARVIREKAAAAFGADVALTGIPAEGGA